MENISDRDCGGGYGVSGGDCDVVVVCVGVVVADIGVVVVGVVFVVVVDVGIGVGSRFGKVVQPNCADRRLP